MITGRHSGARGSASPESIDVRRRDMDSGSPHAAKLAQAA
jgi:hypothetical protein